MADQEQFIELEHLQDRYKQLIKQYNEISHQLITNLNPANTARLRSQLELLENETMNLENEIKALSAAAAASTVGLAIEQDIIKKKIQKNLLSLLPMGIFVLVSVGLSCFFTTIISFQGVLTDKEATQNAFITQTQVGQTAITHLQASATISPSPHPPELDVVFVVETLDAEATRIVAIVRATEYAVQTAPAAWTSTSTVDITASIEALRTQEGQTATALNDAKLTSIALINTVSPNPTASPYATETSTTTATSVAIVGTPVMVRTILGLGTVRLYSPSQVRRGETLRIELQLAFDAYAITPTPAGPLSFVTLSAMTSTSTSIPSTPFPTETPKPLIKSATDIRIYDRMGASLICNSKIFDGCDKKAASTIHLGYVTTWVWILSPLDAAIGSQDLDMVLWSGDTDQASPDWTYSFKVEVINPRADLFFDTITSNLQPIFGLIIAAVTGAFVLYRYRRQNKTDQSDGKKQNAVVRTKAANSHKSIK